MFEQHLQGEDQEFVIPPHPKYEFKLTSEQKITTETLVIALDGPAALFAHSLITSKSPQSRINFLKAKQISLADIYVNQKTKTTFIIFNGEVQKMKEVYFAEFIQQNFTFSKIIILTHQYINNLQKKSKVGLQHLKTSAWKENVGCNQYQEGLMGLAADVLVWAQINRVPACCYVGLFNDYELSRECIKEVFGTLVGKQGMEEVTDIGQKIKKYNMKKYSNNLYL